MVDRARRREQGFSLIELTVVVLIVGLLAAVAIPMYLGAQSSSQDAATRSDLSSARLAMATYIVKNDGRLAASTTQLAPYGYAPSSDTDSPEILAGSDAGEFCMDSRSRSGQWFTVSDRQGVARGRC